MFGKATFVALFAGLAAAVHAPVGEPSGNPITAPLNEIVPAGKPFTIKWQPTTPNAVSILLLRGPSTNVVPLGAPIAEGIANSGSFEWTPSLDLEADVTHYGIQLIDDITGQYQYSTQFGISKEGVVSSSSEDSYGPSSTEDSYASTSEESYPTSIPVYNATSAAPTKVGTTSHYVASTGSPYHNSTIIKPTGSLTVPSSLKTSATPVESTPAGASSATPSVPESTGAAGQLRAGLGLAGAIAGMVFML